MVLPLPTAARTVFLSTTVLTTPATAAFPLAAPLMEAITRRLFALARTSTPLRRSRRLGISKPALMPSTAGVACAITVLFCPTSASTRLFRTIELIVAPTPAVLPALKPPATS